MKITALKTYHVRPRWLLLKIETDAGIVGWGEPLLEGRAQTVDFLCQEQLTLGETLLKEPIQVESGYARIPDGPGLGVEIDEEKLTGLIFDGIWETPQFARKDGAFTEW